jgi:FAD/FMN-containing dehydrogenase
VLWVEHAGAASTGVPRCRPNPEHVQDAVRLAAQRRLPIRVQSTGHGGLAASTEGMLIDTSGLGGVRVNPDRQIAEIGAGVRWQELLDVAQGHGLPVWLDRHPRSAPWVTHSAEEMAGWHGGTGCAQT